MPPAGDEQCDTYFPVALKLTGRRVVVIGGGKEAARKVRAILACRADLVVIGPEVCPAIAELAENSRLTLIPRRYQQGDLEGAFIAIDCDLLDGGAIRAEANRRGVPLNVLDEPEMCDWIAMATFSRDGLQVAVHSSGKSAALTRKICEMLQAEIGPAYAELTRLLGELRPIVHRMIPTAAGRRAFWLGLITSELLDRVGAGLDAEELKREILAQAAAYGPAGPTM